MASYILSLETATHTCSVALHHQDQLLAVQDYHLEKSHSSILHSLVRDMLGYCELGHEDLAAVAISMGPGSYTGLRIGTSAAKGLCFSLDIPLIAVDTLEAMAYSVQNFNLKQALLCPMLDARRMEVYCQIRDTYGKEIMETQPMIIEENSFVSYLHDNEILFFGNGSTKCKKLIQANSKNAHFIDGIEPSAASVGAIAWRKYCKKEFVDLAYFVPNYLKEFRSTKPRKK